MAEIIVAREGGTRPINGISQRTRSFGSDTYSAITRRGQSLLRQYAGYNGLYQTSERVTERETLNRRRINRAVNNMILKR